MRITRISATPVYVPYREYYGRAIQSAHGELRIARHGLVEVETADGLIGIGEIPSVFGRSGENYCFDVNTVIAPALLGQDPREIRRLARKMDMLLEHSEPATAAVEMALLDLLGKHLNIPVYMLLGGKQRDFVHLSYSVMYGTPDEMGGMAAELTAEGFGTLKVKCGQSLERDIAAVKAVRQAVKSNVRVRIDANGCWPHLKTALAYIDGMSDFDVELYEQPLPASALDDLQILRSLIRRPISIDETVWSPKDAWRALTAGAADILNVYVSEAGGILKAMQIFEMAQLAGAECTIGSMPELGVGTAAQIHLAIAANAINYASDVCGSKYFSADIIKEELPIREGKVFSLEGAGLGVTLNRDALREFSVAPRSLN